jgi:TM2 domain-containing membrane protein YozV
VLLGLFLGLFGAHNFYAGYTKNAVIQLLLTMLVGWLILPLFAVAIWNLVEVCTVNRDASGRPFV